MNAALERVVQQEVESNGYELVELRNGGTRSRPVIEVRIDRRDGTKITVEDCARVSRAIEQQLDGSPLVNERYVLQVSSPGERPLRTPDEWRRFVGRFVNVLSPLQGGRFEGKLVALEGEPGAELVVLDMERAPEKRIPLADVKEARLSFRF